jgi:hypothetical protein
VVEGLDQRTEQALAGRGGSQYLPSQPQGQSLADVLERVLDKGIVIAGDIQVRLLDIELLTIKLRLLVASVDKAREIGINWWENDEFVTAGKLGKGGEGDENGDGQLSQLTQRVKELEGRLEGNGAGSPARQASQRRGS